MKGNMLYLADVRDVADALLLVYEKQEANGRYICCSYNIETWDLAEKLRSMYPHFSYPNWYIFFSFISLCVSPIMFYGVSDFSSDEKKPSHLLSSERLKQLGWQDMTIEACVRDTVEDFLKKNILEVN